MQNISDSDLQKKPEIDSSPGIIAKPVTSSKQQTLTPIQNFEDGEVSVQEEGEDVDGQQITVQPNLKSLYNLGSGAQGSVEYVIDTLTRERYAMKCFNNMQTYQFERRMAQRFNDISELAVQVQYCDDEKLYILYECGQCSLAEFAKGRSECGVYWFERQQELELLAKKLFQSVMELFVRGLLHSDIKPANIVLVKQRFLHIYDVRLIDFGIATDEWQCVTGYTPSYYPCGVVHISKNLLKDLKLSFSVQDVCSKNCVCSQYFVCGQQSIEIFEEYFKNEKYWIQQSLLLIEVYYNKDIYRVVRMLLEEHEPQLIAKYIKTFGGATEAQQQQQKQHQKVSDLIQDVERVADAIEQRTRQIASREYARKNRFLQQLEPNSPNSKSVWVDSLQNQEDRDKTLLPQFLAQIDQQRQKLSPIEDLSEELHACEQCEMFERALMILDQIGEQSVVENEQLCLYYLKFLNMEGNVVKSKRFLQACNITQRDFVSVEFAMQLAISSQADTLRDIFLPILLREVADESKTDLSVARVHCILARYHKNLQNVREALRHFAKALDILESLRQPTERILLRFDEAKSIYEANLADPSQKQNNTEIYQIESEHSTQLDNEDYKSDEEDQQIDQDQQDEANKNKKKQLKNVSSINLQEQQQEILALQKILKIMVSRDPPQNSDAELDIVTADVLRHLSFLITSRQRIHFYEREKQIRNSLYARCVLSRTNRAEAVLIHNFSVYYSNIERRHQKALAFKLESQRLKSILDGDASLSFANGLYSLGLNYWNLERLATCMPYLHEAMLLFQKLAQGKRANRCMRKLLVLYLARHRKAYFQNLKLQLQAHIEETTTTVNDDTLTTGVVGKSEEELLRLAGLKERPHEQTSFKLEAWITQIERGWADIGRQLSLLSVPLQDIALLHLKVAETFYFYLSAKHEKCEPLMRSVQKEIERIKEVIKIQALRNSTQSVTESERTALLKTYIDEYHKHLDKYTTVAEVGQTRSYSTEYRVQRIIELGRLIKTELGDEKAQQQLILKTLGESAIKDGENAVCQCRLLRELTERDVRRSILLAKDNQLKLEIYLGQRLLADDFLEKKRKSAEAQTGSVNLWKIIDEQLELFQAVYGPINFRSVEVQLEKVALLGEKLRLFQVLEFLDKAFEFSQRYAIPLTHRKAQIIFLQMVTHKIKHQPEEINDSQVIETISRHIFQYFEESSYSQEHFQKQQYVQLGEIYELLKIYFKAEKIYKKFKDDPEIFEKLIRLVDQKKQLLQVRHNLQSQTNSPRRAATTSRHFN